MGCSGIRASGNSIVNLKSPNTGINFNQKREELVSTIFNLYSILSKCSAAIENFVNCDNKALATLARIKECCIKENLKIIQILIANIDSCIEYSECTARQMKSLEETATKMIEKITKNRVFSKDLEFLGDEDYKNLLYEEMILQKISLHKIELDIEREIEIRQKNNQKNSKKAKYIRKKYIKVRD